jgi:hypothetical protein
MSFRRVERCWASSSCSSDIAATAVAIGAVPSAVSRKLLRVCFLARRLDERDHAADIFFKEVAQKQATPPPPVDTPKPVDKTSTPAVDKKTVDTVDRKAYQREWARKKRAAKPKPKD